MKESTGFVFLANWKTIILCGYQILVDVDAWVSCRCWTLLVGTPLVCPLRMQLLIDKRPLVPGQRG